MLCVAGFDGYLKEVNPSWQHNLGWTAAELTSRPYAEFMHPDDRAITPTSSFVVDGQHVMQYENRYRTRDGSYRWLSWMATPNAEEGVIYAAAHDITKAKLEAQMAAAEGAVIRIAAKVDRLGRGGLANAQGDLYLPRLGRRRAVAGRAPRTGVGVEAGLLRLRQVPGPARRPSSGMAAGKSGNRWSASPGSETSRCFPKTCSATSDSRRRPRLPAPSLAAASLFRSTTRAGSPE